MSGTIHLIKKKNLYISTNTSFYGYRSLPKKHNHIEIIFKDLKIIYNDPRRFGFFLFIPNKTQLIKRFNHLGPEPFSKIFNLNYLLKYLLNNTKYIKSYFLDQKFVS